MPIVYACIVPTTSDPGTRRTADAVETVASDLRSYAPDVAFVVTPPSPARPNAIGVATGGERVDPGLANRVLEAASTLAMPATEINAPETLDCPEAVRDALIDARLVVLASSVLSAAEHIGLGRELTGVLGADERRIVLVACGVLASARGPDDPGDAFDKYYRLAIGEWGVKWLSAVEQELRRRAREDCVAQTAVVMGVLSGSRIQPRVLSYEAPSGTGLLVAAIDVLGDRRAKRRL